METLIIDNFHGSVTPYSDGDINSGLAYLPQVFGYDPFTYPGNLTWYEDIEQIDSAGSVITDMILDGKPRVESGILYIYAIGHTGRLYKIQVNDPTTYNPNYDNPVLLATLTIDTPTFTRGGFMNFFGATEKIYIGHDKGVNSINFDGTGEAAVGVSATWTQNVPRPLKQFIGSLFIGNGSNIAQVDSTATVTTYTKLSPAFPTATQVRDIDVTPDGNYLQIVVAGLPLSDITLSVPDTSILSPADSYLFSWDGSSAGYTSYTTYSAVTMGANLTFNDQQYLFGYDGNSGGVWNPTRKLFTSSPVTGFGGCPLPNAVFALSQIVYWGVPLPFGGALYGLVNMYGALSDFEYKPGYWSTISPAALAPETDIQRIGYCQPVSNLAEGASSNGYADNRFGVTKVYFSTLETSASTTAYRFYKWSPAPTGTGDAIVGAVYETQHQPFSKKQQIKQVRIYGRPWQSGASFTVDLIGSNDDPISGASKTFTAGGNLTVGTDYAWYTPECAPTYVVGLRITNEGTTNHVITKVEIDHNEGGQ